MTEELCKEGQRLYDAINERKNDSYDDYRRHIIRCKKCKKGLGLSRNIIHLIRDDLKGRGKKILL